MKNVLARIVKTACGVMKKPPAVAYEECIRRCIMRRGKEKSHQLSRPSMVRVSSMVRL